MENFGRGAVVGEEGSVLDPAVATMAAFLSLSLRFSFLRSL